MFFCFVFGQEPWLLPPAIEMVAALKARGHTVKIVYAEYIGRKPESTDYDDADTYEVVTKKSGWRRLLTHRYLAASTRKMLKTHKVDVLISCDIMSLHAISRVSTRAVCAGYWGFEIVDMPAKIKMSYFLYRAFSFPKWVGRLNFCLAPSESRMKKMLGRLKREMPHQVIYNCRQLKLQSGASPECKSLRGRLVYTGMISEAQYIEEIVDALELLDRGVTLSIAGPANAQYLEKLRSRIDKSSMLAGRVTLLGRLTRENVYKLIEDSDIGFVFYNSSANAEAADPAPNKLSDYIAGKIWIVGGNQPYIKDWLEGRGAGVCVDKINKEAIAAAVQAIMTDKRFSDRAVLHNLYESELNMDVQAQKLLALLEQLAGRA